ncbi:NTP pyrophosphohydrolase, partial [Curtobacterium flaccumfaciens]|nr:NTP pyrophosphohydrolase [Curtobacterium flaccumfaciens]
QVSALAAGGVPASLLDLPFARWWPRWTVVLEGEARAAADVAATGAVNVVRAPASGDDAIVESARAAVQAGDGPVVVVTADRELRDRVEALGAVVHGPSWLRDQL